MQLYYLPYICLLNASLTVESQGRDNIFVQKWQLHAIVFKCNNTQMIMSNNTLDGIWRCFSINNIISRPMIGPGIVEVRTIPYSCHDRTTILSLSWYSKIKEAVNQPIYGIVYNFQIISNYWFSQYL